MEIEVLTCVNRAARVTLLPDNCDQGKISPLSRAGIVSRERAAQDLKKIALTSMDRLHWEFCLCYRNGEFSHWEWRRHDRGGTITSAVGFSSLSTCVQDAMKHGYTGGGKIMPGIVGSPRSN